MNKSGEIRAQNHPGKNFAQYRWKGELLKKLSENLGPDENDEELQQKWIRAMRHALKLHPIV